MAKDNQKIEDFDFVDATKDSGKEKEEEKKSKKEEEKKSKKEEETPETMMNKLKGKLGSKTKEIKVLKKRIATSGSLTPAIIKEARKLAESKKGLKIDDFMQKHKLINIDLEQMLHAPLKKDGSLA